MNIPAVVLAEASQTPPSEETPTLPASQVTKLWSGAAVMLARRLVDCARIKQRCFDVLDTEGARRAYVYAKELQELSKVLEGLPLLAPEVSAQIQRQAVDRVMSLYEESSSSLLALAKIPA